MTARGIARCIAFAPFLVLAAALAALASAGLDPAAAWAQAPSGGCTACHAKLADKLPAGHPDATGMAVAGCLGCHARGGGATPFEWSMHLGHFRNAQFSGTCWSCHTLDADGALRVTGDDPRPAPRATRDVVDKMNPFYRSWATSSFLDRRHADKNVGCAGCHGATLPRKRVGNDGCLACHTSYEAVAQKTKHAEPNPHDSHVGEVRCTLCHRGHAAPVLYCNQCHSFELKTK
jgi:hypothetical protein